MRTVCYIAGDYGQCIHFAAKNEATEYQKLHLELSVLQALQESQTHDMWKTTDPQEILRYQTLIVETRVRMEEVAKLLVNIRHKELRDGRESPFEVVHQRSAYALREMCVLNKGVYIKLGKFNDYS